MVRDGAQGASGIGSPEESWRGERQLRVLIIDNYDSFTYNLAQLIGSLGAEPMVYRNDQILVEEAKKLKPDRIVISPGPGNPANQRDFGICTSILREISPNTPTLGVCLGHQGIVHVYGGKIGKACRIMHGKTSRIKHDGQGIYEEVENPIEATRYHSLVGLREHIPTSLKVAAISLDDGEIMGVRHKSLPIEGVQFHPESVLTSAGTKILSNFLKRGAR